MHSGFPRGVSPEGQAKQAERAREHMNSLWAERWRPFGRTLSEAGRARIVEAQKRRPKESRRVSDETKAKIAAAHRKRHAAVRSAKDEGAR